jgi:hypothetical protein
MISSAASGSKSWMLWLLLITVVVRLPTMFWVKRNGWDEHAYVFFGMVDRAVLRRAFNFPLLSKRDGGPSFRATACDQRPAVAQFYYVFTLGGLYNPNTFVLLRAEGFYDVPL